MSLNKSISLALVCVFSTTVNATSKFVIYPASGQDKAQQEKDSYVCYNKSVTVTGIDPNKLEKPSKNKQVRVAVAENPSKGATGTGQVVGAVAGGVIGHNNHHTGAGIVLGSIVGGIIGQEVEAQGRKEQRQIAKEQAEEQAQQQAVIRAAYREKMTIFKAEFADCMQDRGYQVR